MRLNAYDLQIGDTYDTLVNKTKLILHEDAISLNIEEQNYEEIKSDSPIPQNIYELGNDMEIRAVLQSSSIDQLKTALNIQDSQLKGTTKFQIPRRKLQWKDLLSVGIPEMWKATDFVVQGDFDETFQSDEAVYLPIVFTPESSAKLEKYFVFEIENDQSTKSTTTISLQVTTDKNVYIDWGDGNTTTVTGDGTLTSYTHDYSSTGEYTVEIYGYMDDLQGIEIINQSFLSGEIAGIHTLSNISTFDIYSTGFGYTSTELINMDTADIDIKDNSLSTSEVDRVLIDLAESSESGATGTLDISGNNAVPSSKADSAITTLQNNGWTLTLSS